jgi:deoxyribodipyrimidine photo-lyase
MRVPAPDGVICDADPSATAGPSEATSGDAVDRVWLTAESLGDDDPALSAHPDATVTFVFDEALLRNLRLTGKRLVFLTQCLADLATRREVDMWRGDPVDVLSGGGVATTYAPVPGWRRRADYIKPSVVHPWPWLVRQHGGAAGSFSAWRKGAKV